jgi:hypothetical protein
MARAHKSMREVKKVVETVEQVEQFTLELTKAEATVLQVLLHTISGSEINGLRGHSQNILAALQRVKPIDSLCIEYKKVRQYLDASICFNDGIPTGFEYEKE